MNENKDPFDQAKEFEEFAERYTKIRSTSLYDNQNILEKLSNKVNKSSSKVLDLGCGSGLPVTKFFQDKVLELNGVDISKTMIEKAKINVPNANLRVCDILDYQYPESYYDLVISFYCIFAVSIKNQFIVLKNIFTTLKPGGSACFSLLPPFDDKKNDFEGQVTFHDSKFWVAYTQPEIYQKRIKEIGFEIEMFDIIQQGPEKLLWVVVKKPI